MAYTLEQLGERYGAWWIDALGEHNHIGGLDSTRWLLDRAYSAFARNRLSWTGRCSERCPARLERDS